MKTKKLIAPFSWNNTIYIMAMPSSNVVAL